MSLSLEHIREFGLLELYAIGELSKTDQLNVEQALDVYPELKQELKEIEHALQFYAEANRVKAPKDLIGKVLYEINEGDRLIENSTNPTKQRGLSRQVILSLLTMSLFLLGLLFLLFNSKNSIGDLKEDNERVKTECDSLISQKNQLIAMYQQLDKVDNKAVKVSATEKYPSTRLIFNTNDESQKNYIQIENLPPIASNQSYQLWSLIGENPPRPLNVFEGDVDTIFEVDYVEGTNAYAITIEPKGGSETPNLEDLIGVFSI